MKNQRLFNSTILFLIVQLAFSQNTKPKEAEGIDSIPFLLSSHNNIILKGLLNDTDSLLLMFHTDAGSMSLISNSTKRMTSIQWSDDTEVNSWGGTSSARFSKNNSFQIGTRIWDSLPVWENENSGPGSDGKIGPNFFENKILEMDFEKGLLMVHATLPNLIDDFQKILLINKEGSFFIEGWTIIDGIRIKNDFLVHSGFGGSILYDNDFSAENKLGEKLEITSESELRDSYGNVLKTKEALLPQFQIGDFLFTDLPIGFFEGSIGNQKVSVLGGDILKRFHIYWDLKDETLYLKPNGLMEIPFKG